MTQAMQNKKNIIAEIQAMQKKIIGYEYSTEVLHRYRIDVLKEMHYRMIDELDAIQKAEKMRLVIDEQSVGIYIGDDEFVRWTVDEVEDDPSVALIMAKAVELFYTNKKQLL